MAFVNCLTQRADAFPVVGSLSKNALAGDPRRLGARDALSAVSLGHGLSIFAFVAITAAAIYMLDVRPALRDATDGSGNW